MKLSKKSRYGLAALIDLAVRSKGGHVSLGSVAEKSEISSRSLEQIFVSLHRAGIVRSVKGAQGGYLLARPAAKITVSEILVALEGAYRLEDEITSKEGDSKRIAGTIQALIIDRVNKQLDDILTNLTLEDLEEYYLGCNIDETYMYYI